MDIVKICGIAVLCAVIGAVLGRALGGTATALKLAGLCMILGGAVALTGDIARQTSMIFGMEHAAEYVSVMTKALGITVLCRICSDVCRDCGDATLASGVESAGKLTLVLLALPMISRLAEHAVSLSEGFS
ncbi:MAG: hypothetical protein E7653_05210 [Ruminococcaceae bacterium]|nr:hypothetical protein [Oscillospiraceae bacterium]